MSGLIGLVLLSGAVACGSSSTSAAVAPTIAGATSCPPAEMEDLTFSGRLTGHVSCSTSPATCDYAWVTPKPPGGLQAPISARAGGQPVHLLINMTGPIAGGGTYVAGNPGESATHTSNYGVTLDGFGAWVSDLGGVLTVSSDDSSGVAGTVDVVLSQQFGTPLGGKITVTGTWRCVKPAGF